MSGVVQDALLSIRTRILGAMHANISTQLFKPNGIGTLLPHEEPMEAQNHQRNTTNMVLFRRPWATLAVVHCLVLQLE